MKVIHRELCKKLKFDHMKKWFMHNPESIKENEMRIFLLEFEIQTDPLISARQPDLIMVHKKEKSCRIVDFTVLENHRVKLKEYKMGDKYLNLARVIEKCAEHSSDYYNNCNWYSRKDWYKDQRTWK